MSLGEKVKSVPYVYIIKGIYSESTCVRSVTVGSFKMEFSRLNRTRFGLPLTRTVHNECPATQFHDAITLMQSPLQ